MTKTLKALLGAVALSLAVPHFAHAAAATASPLSAQTPTVRTVEKKVGSSANFLSRFQVVGCTFNPISMAADDGVITSCTIPGLTTADRVLPLPNRTTTAVATAWCAVPINAHVSAADTLSIRLQNISGITCDMASTEYEFMIFRPNPEAD